MGIHIHCPEERHKDGPSAGAAITVALVSLFTDSVNNKIALTGELIWMVK